MHVKVPAPMHVKVAFCPNRFASLLSCSQAKIAHAGGVLFDFELGLKFLGLHLHHPHVLAAQACKRSRIQGYFREDYALDAAGGWEHHTAAPCSPEKIMQQTNQYMDWKTLAKRCWVSLRLRDLRQMPSVSPTKGHGRLH